MADWRQHGVVRICRIARVGHPDGEIVVRVWSVPDGGADWEWEFFDRVGILKVGWADSEDEAKSTAISEANVFRTSDEEPRGPHPSETWNK